MKKYRLKIFGILVALFFVFLLPFVSLLGENDRAITAVQQYFSNISTNEFTRNASLYSENLSHQKSDLAASIAEQFSLETALLELYGIPANGNYSIKAKRDRIWVPYMGDDKLKLSIQAIGHDESGSVVRNYLKFGSGAYLEDFFIMVREGGRWKIDDIVIKDSRLSEYYNKAQAVMNKSSILWHENDRLVLKEQNMTLSEMDPIERRIMAFQLTKALNILGQSTTN